MGGETPQPQNFEASQETGMCTEEACSARIDTAEMSLEEIMKKEIQKPADAYGLNVQMEKGSEKAPNGKIEKTITYRFTGPKGDEVATLTYNEDHDLYTLRAKGGKALATSRSFDEVITDQLPNHLQRLSAV